MKADFIQIFKKEDDANMWEFHMTSANPGIRLEETLKNVRIGHYLMAKEEYSMSMDMSANMADYAQIKHLSDLFVAKPVC